MRTISLRMAALLAAAAAGFFTSSFAAQPKRDTPAIEWQPWSDGVWARAKAEHKLVLLDLGAVWCHWCHVMDETTYRNAAVTELIQKHFVAIRVDQDSRPD